MCDVVAFMTSLAYLQTTYKFPTWHKKSPAKWTVYEWLNMLYVVVLYISVYPTYTEILLFRICKKQTVHSYQVETLYLNYLKRIQHSFSW